MGIRRGARQAGISLVEIMVALVAGLVLIAGVGEIYLNNKQTYRMQDAQSRLQENARYAIGLLSDDMRKVGFQGCRSLASITPRVIANPPAITWTAASVMTGNEASGSSWTPALPAVLTGPRLPKAGTDVITLQFGDSCGAHLVGNMAAINANIQIPAANTCGIIADDVLLISDCITADIFRASSVSSGSGKQTVAHASNVNTDVNLSRAYGPDAEILVFRSYTYFIRNGAGGEPALWRLDNAQVLGGNNPAELVEGVEDFQVLYGEDTDSDGTPNRYVAANLLGNWGNVVSARISLLLRTTENNLTSAAQIYAYNGATVTAPDRRLRRVFTTTIGIRNRLP